MLSVMSLSTASGPEAVADALWDRVRRLARLADRLRDAEDSGELDEEGYARLERARVRLARAVERAQLADDLSDRLADMDARRARRARDATRVDTP